MKITLPALNIQHPISQLIVIGEKVVETRTYKMPDRYVGKELLLIETPGKTGKFRARAIARVTFGKPFEYMSKKAFYDDIAKHKVGPDSKWAWSSKRKWGWPIVNLKHLKAPIEVHEPRGIVFTKSVSIEL